MYMQLTEAEASFRALKSELSIRPLFHQRESRVKAHVLVAFPGYALWVTLKHLLQRRPAMVPQLSASGVVNIQLLSPMKARFAIGRFTEPTAEQKSLLAPARPEPPRTFEVSFKM
jgi:hypothetical protein